MKIFTLRCFISLLLLSIAFTGKAQNIDFKDANFKQVLLDNSSINTDDDKMEISVAEAEAFTGELNLWLKNITDLSGIEYFTNITELNCSGNSLTSLDVSANTSLRILNCYNNKLNSLTLGSNTVLEELKCTGNDFISLDVSKNTGLTKLECYSNSITSLDLSNNTNLLEVNCSSNELSSLTLGNNTVLKTLRCRTNKLNSLDVSQNAALTDLICYENQLSSLDVSGNENLDYLSCEDNNLGSLDVTGNAKLLYLNCSNNSLNGLDVSGNPDLTTLSCMGNQIKELDVSENLSLTNLSCSNNPFENGLDISKNIKLELLSCYGNQLQTLTVTHLVSLSDLNCANNQLSSLDLSANQNLMYLYCYSNRLSSLDVSNMSSLEELDCSGNKLTDNFNLTSDEFYDLNCIDNKFPFSVLQQIKNEYSYLTYTSDSTILSPQSGISGDFKLDYSAEASFNTIATTFTWYDDETKETVDETVVKETDTPGVFEFLVPGTYHCKMSNANFTDSDSNPVTLQSETITVYLNIPDDNFKQALIANDEIDTDGDDEISLSEAVAFDGQLAVNGKNIVDLTGIEYFTNITELNCSYNQISSLDVSQNTALTELLCNSNQLQELDLSKNTALKILNCDYNQLESLDLAQNIALTELFCDENQLQKLDLSKNTALISLYCEYNQLSSLDVSQNALLTDLYCSYNQISILDVSQNSALEELVCDNNQVSSLDLDKNTSLNKLYCSENQLTSLDLSQNSLLVRLDCDNNRLSSLDLNQNISSAERFECDGNKFPFSALQVIKNHFSDLEYTSDSTILSAQTGVFGFEVDYSAEASFNDIATIFTWYNDSDEEVDERVVKETDTPGVFQFLANGTYYCKMSNAYFEDGDGNPVTLQTETVTISKSIIDIPDAIFKAYLVGNTTINTDGDDEISQTEAAAYNGQIHVQQKGIKDLSGIEYFINITNLLCYDNELSSLDVSNNTAITFLNCDANELHSLIIGNNTQLHILYCGNNQLTELDVSQNTALEQLECHQNQLSELDLSANTELNILLCYQNRLNTLDISKIEALTSLSCSNNKFPFSVLKSIKDEFSSLEYASDSTIFSKEEGNYGHTVDYGLEVSFNDNATTFIWYNDSDAEVDETVVKQTDTPGVFEFLATGTFYCRMTNAYFTDSDSNPMTLQTESITISTIVESITFNNLITEAKVNDVIELSATAPSGLDVSFEVTEGNASLSGNSITFNEAGTVKIRAYHDGNIKYAAAEEIATIIVSKKTQSISFTDDLVSDVEVGESIALSATASSGLDVSFEVMEGNASLDGGTITFNETGRVIVRAYQDGSDEYLATERTFEFTVSTATSIEDDELSKASVRIYPNPVVEEVNIKFNSSKRKTIRIYNLIGKVQIQTEAFATKTMNLANLPSGIYIMKIQSEDEIVNFKIIKK